jgi:hypothetical protein
VAHGAVATADPADGATWYYLSTGPTAQLGPDGHPLASILDAGEVGLVQISCQLDPPAGELESLRRLIATTAPSDRPIVLRSAVTAVRGITVSCTVDAGGGDAALGRSAGSGYPPHTAVFQLSLTGDRLLAARAALAGEHNQVEIRYELETIHGPSSAVADVGDWFGRGVGHIDEPSAAIEEDKTC